MRRRRDLHSLNSSLLQISVHLSPPAHMLLSTLSPMTLGLVHSSLTVQEGRTGVGGRGGGGGAGWGGRIRKSSEEESWESRI